MERRLEVDAERRLYKREMDVTHDSCARICNWESLRGSYTGQNRSPGIAKICRRRSCSLDLSSHLLCKYGRFRCSEQGGRKYSFRSACWGCHTKWRRQRYHREDRTECC